MLSLVIRGELSRRLAERTGIKWEISERECFKPCISMKQSSINAWIQFPIHLFELKFPYFKVYSIFSDEILLLKKKARNWNSSLIIFVILKFQFKKLNHWSIGTRMNVCTINFEKDVREIDVRRSRIFWPNPNDRFIFTTANPWRTF